MRILLPSIKFLFIQLIEIMTVLLLGATGSLGSRILPSLISHSHKVAVIVRNPRKFRDIMPLSILSRITLVTGDATETSLIEQVLRDQNIRYIINAAGSAKMLTSSKCTDQLKEIVSATVQAADTVNMATNRLLDAWFIGGMLLLKHPGNVQGHTLKD
jgi:putative NADH-flavin reductase